MRISDWISDVCSSDLLFPNRHAEVVRDDGPLLVLDGGHGYGQVIAREATTMAINRARTHGVALLALRNSNHVGRVGTYGEQCARSEARRVGKEWVSTFRIRGWPYHSKKQKNKK